MMTGAKRQALNGSLSLLSLVVTLLLLEGTVRVGRIWVIPDYGSINWYRPSDLAGVPYLLKPNLDVRWEHARVRTNADGLRADSSYRQGVPQTLRILALGDSVTFGFGVGQEDTFPRRLEEVLNGALRQEQHVEVINAGVNGFSLRDEANYLPHLIERYHPNLVVWTLVPNDYDDSFEVRSDGFVSLPRQQNAMSSTSEFARGQDPQQDADFDDFRASMTPEALRWSAALPPPRETALTAMLAHSRAYRWLAWLAAGAARSWSLSAGDTTVRQRSWKGPDGTVHPFPAHVALFSHRTRMTAFNDDLAEAKRLLAAERTMLIVVNTALPLMAEHMTNSDFYRYFDSGALLGEPFLRFHERHSLRWDSHFSPQGNELFAEAVAEALVCAGALRGPLDACQDLARRQRELGNYWSAFQVSQDAFASRFRSFIDLDDFVGFPQIVGGIYPPREFPNAISTRAEFLFTRPVSADFLLEMSTDASDGVNLSLHFAVGNRADERQVVTKGGRARVELDLSTLLADSVSTDLIELSLSCVAATCPSGRLHRLGFVPKAKHE